MDHFLLRVALPEIDGARKKVYAWGMLLFTVFSLFCSIAQNTFQLNIFRFFQGVSAAFMVPQGVGMIPYVFPDFKDRTKAFGIYGSIAGAASVIGQFLGGLLPELNIWGIEGWRLIFIINIPLGGTAFVLSILKTERTAGYQTKNLFDVFGLLLLTAFLITLIYPLIVSGESHWPFWSIAMLVFSFLLLFIFYLYEKYRLAKLNPALIDVNLFSLKEFNIGILAAVFYYIAQDSYFFS